MGLLKKADASSCSSITDTPSQLTNKPYGAGEDPPFDDLQKQSQFGTRRASFVEEKTQICVSAPEAAGVWFV